MPFAMLSEVLPRTRLTMRSGTEEPLKCCRSAPPSLRQRHGSARCQAATTRATPWRVLPVRPPASTVVTLKDDTPVRRANLSRVQPGQTRTEVTTEITDVDADSRAGTHVTSTSHVLGGGVVDVVDWAPRPATLDQLGLVPAIDRLGQGIVVGVAGGADRGGDPGLGESFGVPGANYAVKRDSACATTEFTVASVRALVHTTCSRASRTSGVVNDVPVRHRWSRGRTRR